MEKYSFQIPDVSPTVNKILFKCQKQLLWFALAPLTVAAPLSTSEAEQQPHGVTAGPDSDRRVRTQLERY